MTNPPDIAKIRICQMSRAVAGASAALWQCRLLHLRNRPPGILPQLSSPPAEVTGALQTSRMASNEMILLSGAIPTAPNAHTVWKTGCDTCSDVLTYACHCQVGVADAGGVLR